MLSALNNDFPSISPSVYIAYHDLQAAISCTDYGYIGRGKSYNTTIAYAPEDLSASISARAHQTCAFSEINYTKLANYPFGNATDFILSLPDALSSVDPAWSTCAPATYGAFDPPSTMRKATALTDPGIESTSSATPAAPGGHVDPANAPATMTPSATSFGSQVPLVARTPATPRTTDLQSPDPAKPVDPAIIQGSHDPAASESPSPTSPSIPPDGREPPNRDNPSSALRKDADGKGDGANDKQDPSSYFPTAPAAGNDGVDPSPTPAGSVIASVSWVSFSGGTVLPASIGGMEFAAGYLVPNHFLLPIGTPGLNSHGPGDAGTETHVLSSNGIAVPSVSGAAITSGPLALDPNLPSTAAAAATPGLAAPAPGKDADDKGDSAVNKHDPPSHISMAPAAGNDGVDPSPTPAGSAVASASSASFSGGTVLPTNDTADNGPAYMINKPFLLPSGIPASLDRHGPGDTGTETHILSSDGIAVPSVSGVAISSGPSALDSNLPSTAATPGRAGPIASVSSGGNVPVAAGAGTNASGSHSGSEGSAGGGSNGSGVVVFRGGGGRVGCGWGWGWLGAGAAVWALGFGKGYGVVVGR